MIHFFGYFKATNHIGISSVGFEKAAIFLRKRDFKVNKLQGFKDNEEINKRVLTKEGNVITLSFNSKTEGSA